MVLRSNGSVDIIERSQKLSDAWILRGIVPRESVSWEEAKRRWPNRKPKESKLTQE